MFYRKIETLPLIVAVGLAQHEVFGTYWRESIQIFVAAVTLTVVVRLSLRLSEARTKT